jgi:hypothetical protein
MIDDGAVLVRLDDTGRTVADPTTDIRGRTVLDESGAVLGTVEDLLVDAGGRRVRFLRVVRGGIFGFGATPCYVPVGAVWHVDTVVHVRTSSETVTGEAAYDPKLTSKPVDPAADYHFHLAPYWVPGCHPPWYARRRPFHE